MATQNNVTESLGLTANQWQFLCRPDAYVAASEGKLDPNSTPRQLRTARDIVERMNGSYGQSVRRGILLADDVGLGKTAVASFVAWVIASAGSAGVVKILVPNDVMRRKWVEELRFHVPMLNACAPSLLLRVTLFRERRT
jgi:RecG-like helicase